MICGIRGGKTFSGAREALKQSWNSKGDGVFLIIAPTYSMLKRTTWREFKLACGPLIKDCNETDKIITLRNGRTVHGHSSDRPDRIRNETAVGFWVDEARECKDFARLWDILLGRVLSTGGKGFVTSSPNSYDDLHDIFIEQDDKEYGVVRFSTYENKTIDKEAIDSLASKYDEKTMRQELLAEFVTFEGAVYYTFDRKMNAGDLAVERAVYDPTRPINLCCDFNVDPMSWVVTQYADSRDGIIQVHAIDEIFLRNSNTLEACNEFKSRYPNHVMGVSLYGDATGKNRSTSSHVTDWKIIQDELQKYDVSMHVPTKNVSEKDRINAVNAMLCNSKGQRRVLINPKCKNLIRDLEQVTYKEGSVQIDKNKDLRLTHPSDALGYFIEREYSLNKDRFVGLKI